MISVTPFLIRFLDASITKKRIHSDEACSHFQLNLLKIKSYE